VTPDEVPDEWLTAAGAAWRTAPQKRNNQPTRMRYALAAVYAQIAEHARTHADQPDTSTAAPWPLDA
jgi:hypothetical protein